ncbi:MAG: DNA mismatch repair endonuclease MutL [Planctomycetes bacterium]|nr:DNA mismatch repair endonuclease MutL [Planctomycetota bacterium]
MGIIRVLPPGLVNRIAAGECIERPASVVKELVENALDAGAGRIDVTILDGGRGLIQVSDDGVGMDVADLELAITPHATSKIHGDDDLFSIHTLGFRGEALPSIGAVARLKITARPRDVDVAHALQVDAGEIGRPSPCAAPPGTTVAVRDLFYCVPARRKFLRTNQTEMGHITEQFARIALAHPGVAFSLSHQNRSTHRLPATDDRRKRIADFYGPELAEVLLPVRREGGGVVVDGYVAPPAESRGSGKWEYVFVNGRYVRDRFVSHAIKEAYRSLIDPSRYPVAFILITIDPSHVDVNVHPTKVEVRWRDSNYIHGQVLAALREKFLATNLDRALQTPANDDAYRERVRSAMVDFFTKTRPATSTAPTKHWRGGGAGRKEAQDQEFEPGSAAQRSETTARMPSPATMATEPPRPATTPPAETIPPLIPQSLSPSLPALGTPCGRQPAVQIHNMYLVVETPDGLMIIDQHALHERILYEELRSRIADRSLESQRLLLPEVLRVPAGQIEALETHAATLARLGVELTPSGPQSVALHAIPSLIQDRIDATRFVRDLLDLLGEQGSRPEAETLVHEILDMMACKAAVKAGDPLTTDEIAALLARRELAERSSNCPHGRPTTLHLTLRDLERQFKRR